MGLFKRGKKEIIEEPEVPRQYIDLGKKDFTGMNPPERDTIWVKKIHINSFQDVRELTDLVYNKNILVLDTKALTGDSIELKRITSELKRAATEVNGDLAQIDRGIVMVTPGPIKIDRTSKK